MNWRRFGPFYEREAENRAMVRTKCVSITVDPAELARAVNSDGVEAYRSRDLVEALIERARVEAIASMLGVKGPLPAALPSHKGAAHG